MRPLQRSEDTDDIQAIQQFASNVGPTSADYYKTRIKYGLEHNPISKLYDLGQEQLANSQADYSGYNQRYGVSTDELSTYENIFAPKRVNQKELNEKYGIPGALTFNSPMTEKAAEMKYNRISRDLERREIINSYTRHNMLADFGVDLTVSMLDPLNLALMFVPGIGEARFAEMGLGKIASRAAAGATQGAMGMIAAEPLNVMLDKSLGYEHTLQDTVHNIMIGTALGAGLHTTIGTIGDLVNKKVVSTKAHNAATRTAIAQYIEGRDIKVEPVVKADLLTDDLTVKQHEIESIGKVLYRGQSKKDIIPRSIDNASKDNIFKTQAVFLSEDKNYALNYGENIFEYHKPKSMETLNLSKVNKEEFNKLFNDTEFEKPTYYEQYINKSRIVDKENYITDLVKQISGNEDMREFLVNKGYKAIKYLGSLEGRENNRYDYAILHDDALQQTSKLLDEIKEFRKTQPPEQALQELNDLAESQSSINKPSKQYELKDIISNYKLTDDIEKAYKIIESDTKSLETSAREITGNNKVFDKINEDYDKIEQDLQREEKGILSAVACVVNKVL